MSQVNYIKLFDLINNYPDKIETIKDQYLMLLSELSNVTYIETEIFKKQLERINASNGIIIVGYIGQLFDMSFEIVASGTVIIEPKIIRNCQNVGHVEDIVVTKVMRGKGICGKILSIIKRIARENNCYKIILDCDPVYENIYEKNGLIKKGTQMTEYF